MSSKKRTLLNFDGWSFQQKRSSSTCQRILWWKPGRKRKFDHKIPKSRINTQSKRTILAQKTGSRSTSLPWVTLYSVCLTLSPTTDIFCGSCHVRDSERKELCRSSSQRQGLLLCQDLWFLLELFQECPWGKRNYRFLSEFCQAWLWLQAKIPQNCSNNALNFSLKKTVGSHRKLWQIGWKWKA